ncbi:serine protease [Bordetella ansorpii]|uniref:Serine protease n=1 Tax=Bordetella ansorpii TaxID=288768 RepID=A0A146ARI6_9BORD|nr:serine protease [Bordetella ansorpii]CZZ91127.1 serine protease [Bordetella ansorpii]
MATILSMLKGLPVLACRLFLVVGASLLAPVGAVQALPLIGGLEAHATGFFINSGGDVLTAHHAVSDCGDIFVVKDGKVVRASLAAGDDKLDIAVLRTALKPYLSATFVAGPEIKVGRQAVFAESYNTLQRMPDRARTLFNAFAEPGNADGNDLSLISSVRPGASGSPVLGAAGLMLGVVVERFSLDGRPSGRVALSAAQASGATGATRVKAVSATHVKSFLRNAGIAFNESDEPQLGPMQAQAPRAATLSVGVICG